MKPLTRKAWAQPLRAGSSVNPVLRSCLPEHSFPLVTSLKASAWGRAGQCERESTSQEHRGMFRLWRCCFKRRCLLQQSKNSQAWKGRRLLWEQPNGKRPFLSLAWRQGVSSLLSGQSREPLCVLPAGSPCLPPGSAATLGRSRNGTGTKAELWRRAAAWVRAGRGPRAAAACPCAADTLTIEACGANP